MISIEEKKNRLIEDIFFRPTWYSIFLNPYFINRNSIYGSIKKIAKNTVKDSIILDIGCGLKPYRNLFETRNYTGIDIRSGGHADNQKTVDKFYDGENIPYNDNVFDLIICTQVLEHAEKPEKIIQECSRVLKPKGTIFISMPFIYPEHETPFDFQRYTQYKHRNLLEKNGFKVNHINKTTGFFGTFGQLLVIHIFESIKFKASILKTLLSIFLLAPIQLLSILLDIIFRKSGPTMDYVVTAKKHG